MDDAELLGLVADNTATRLLLALLIEALWDDMSEVELDDARDDLLSGIHAIMPEPPAGMDEEVFKHHVLESSEEIVEAAIGRILHRRDIRRSYGLDDADLP